MSGRGDIAAVADAPPGSRAAAHVVVVMPAYNAARTLRFVYEAVSAHPVVQEIILVDDASRDETVRLARSLGIPVIVHPHNAGYGANQKTCYMRALERGADIVIMIHADNQYDPAFIPEMIEPIREGRADVVLGSRMRMKGGARRGGMPGWKFFANRILTTFENACLGIEMTDLHTGYRAYSRRALETIPFLRNSNAFVFDTQMIVQSVAFGLKMTEVPVTTRYFPEASSVGFRTSVVYGLGTVRTVLRYLVHRTGILRSRLFQP